MSSERVTEIQTNAHPKHQPISIKNNHRVSIQMRNARERNRVRAVNEAFARLRTVIPYTANRTKRVSKVKTLRKALEYITELQILLIDNCIR